MNSQGYFRESEYEEGDWNWDSDLQFPIVIHYTTQTFKITKPLIPKVSPISVKTSLDLA